jgi:hypothetical protein
VAGAVADDVDDVVDGEDLTVGESELFQCGIRCCHRLQNFCTELLSLPAIEAVGSSEHQQFGEHTFLFIFQHKVDLVTFLHKAFLYHFPEE